MFYQRNCLSNFQSKFSIWYLRTGYFFLLVLMSNFVYGYEDIPTQNKGEQAMIDALRAAIISNKDFTGKQHQIVLGAGMSGCRAFSQPASKDKLHVLMTWQWLDAMKDLAKGTVVIIPEHAIDDDFKQIEAKVNTITIQGVLHTTTHDAIKNEQTDTINKKTDLIVMLAGDTEHQDGTWAFYTPAMAKAFVEGLPKNKNILFLNGPRTGKYLKSGDIDQKAHREGTDAVTLSVQGIFEGKPWTIVDFKFGAPSLWRPSLKFCLDNPSTTLLLPGESISMISEALALGIRPAIYKHQAMTEATIRYVDKLIEQNSATLYPNLPDQKQVSIPESQVDVVAKQLLNILS